VGGPSDSHVEARVIHGNHEVRRVSDLCDTALEIPEELEFAHDLGEPHHRELIQPSEQLHPLPLHERSAETEQVRVRKAPTQRPSDAGPMVVPRRFAGE
jgi:hypothetical protein